MSNRIKIKGNVRNGKGGPQVLKVPTPWHSRDKAPTYSEALNPVRRLDKAGALEAGVSLKRFKKMQKKERKLRNENRVEPLEP